MDEVYICVKFLKLERKKNQHQLHEYSLKKNLMDMD